MNMHPRLFAVGGFSAILTILLLRIKMDPSVKLANWRTAPYSSQSFHQVDKLIPVSPIKRSGSAWEFPMDLQPIDSLVI